MRQSPPALYLVFEPWRGDKGWPYVTIVHVAQDLEAARQAQAGHPGSSIGTPDPVLSQCPAVGEHTHLDNVHALPA